MRGELAAVGAVLLVISFFGWMLTFVNPFLGAYLCLASPILFILGLVLFIVGMVGMESQPTHIVVQQAVPLSPVTSTACPVCGQPLAYYPQVGRWYCNNCKQYR